MLIKTIIRKEDRWYRYHPGVNPFAVLRAVWQNVSKGERVSGASTISMQVVRLCERRERTHISKLIEMFRALQLEFHNSKDEILELYLNLLPYGGNIEGIKAASYLYFGQAPQTLSPAQVTTLAIIPNNPRHLRLGMNNDRIRKERNYWLTTLAGRGYFNSDDLSMAIREPLNVQRLPAPALVPHFAIELHRKFPDQSIIHTYINQNVQKEVEMVLSSEVNRLRAGGITNGAIVVLDNHSNAVIAYAGSASFNENQYLGQVNGCSALRSPGSALKPFLYGLAIDKGVITPRTMLYDVPQDFNGYKPGNYDETYRGTLPASQALALSLNIPAVDLANRIGVSLFIEKLSKGGLNWIEQRKKSLGLSVVLGGCGVTLSELTNFYSCLANQGIYRQLQYVKQNGRNAVDTLFTAESAWMVTEMLTNLRRPDLPNSFESSKHLPHIAWKTGTSYGRRDGWSIGYNPDYTVGVWVGNFDGSGIPDLSGSESAAPILFRIFNTLCSVSQPDWFRKPSGIDFRLVCPESGLPPSEFCENQVMDDYIPSISPNMKCNHKIEVLTDASGQVSYCRACLPESGYRTDFYPNLSPALISYYEEQQVSYKKIPPHNPTCSRIEKSDKPIITSLVDGKEYILYEKSKQQLQLSCNASADVSRVYWYLNNRFYKESLQGEKVFFTPQPGRLKISCSDDKGRNTDIYITISFY